MSFQIKSPPEPSALLITGATGFLGGALAAGLLAMLRYLGGVVGLLVIAFVVDERAVGPAIIGELRAAIDYFMVAMVAAIPFAMVLPARLPKPAEAAAVS